jgi:engulfment/cell motility protein 1
MSASGRSSPGANNSRHTLSPPTNGQIKPVALVPTNNVTTKEGVTVRARIDPTLTVDDVVRQLCINLKLKEPPANYALRDESDELVSNDNLRRKITMKVPLKYGIFFCTDWNS